MPIAVRHLSRYEFSAPAASGLFQLRLTPRSGGGQTVLDWGLELTGGRVEAQFVDHNGNDVVLASLASGAAELIVLAAGRVVVEDLAGVRGRHDALAPLWLFRRQTPRTAPGPALAELAAAAPQAGSDLARLHAVCGLIHAGIRYDIGRTDVHTAAEEAVREGHGVCQDHAHAFCGAARALGFPARYVSGYLLTPEAPVLEASHAWAEAYVEGLGWVGFDAANAICPDARYVRVACGLDYAEAGPISGLVAGASGNLSVSVEVQQQ